MREDNGREELFREAREFLEGVDSESECADLRRRRSPCHPN